MRQKFRRFSDTYAIVVEGETEMWYLQMLKRYEKNLQINIEPKLPHRKNIQDQYDLAKELSNDYTKVFWILDFDVIRNNFLNKSKGKNPTINDIHKIHNHNNIILIINNPCLEFWFLLHFIDTTKNFSGCSRVEKKLRSYLTDYNKNQKYFTKENNDIYSKLKNNLNTAIINSEKIGKFDPEFPYKPCSEMYKLFRELKINLNS